MLVVAAEAAVSSAEVPYLLVAVAPMKMMMRLAIDCSLEKEVVVAVTMMLEEEVEVGEHL